MVRADDGHRVVDIRWGPAPDTLRLASNEVHVWAAAQIPDASAGRLGATLSVDERARAERFYFERDRGRFTMRRGMLRSLIHRYLAIEPASIAFRYGPKGKPELESPDGAALHFNVTDSGDLALFAFARVPGLGVDVEEVRPLRDAGEIARRFFSEPENQEFASVPEPSIPEAFFNCWTRKEAFIKAVGEGLSYPLSRFDVSLRPGDEAALRRIQGDQSAAAGWTLWHLAPANGFIGAVALPARDLSLQCWRL